MNTRTDTDTVSSTPSLLEDLTLTLDAGAGSPTSSPARLWKLDIRLCPQEATVHNHKAKSFLFVLLFCLFLGVGAGFKIRAWAGFRSFAHVS